MDKKFRELLLGLYHVSRLALYAPDDVFLGERCEQFAAQSHKGLEWWAKIYVGKEAEIELANQVDQLWREFFELRHAKWKTFFSYIRTQDLFVRAGRVYKRHFLLGNGTTDEKMRAEALSDFAAMHEVCGGLLQVVRPTQREDLPNPFMEVRPRLISGR